MNRKTKIGKPFVVSLFLFVCVSTSGIASAQHKPEPCELKAKNETHWMQENLVMNAKQYQEVQAINSEFCCKYDSMEAALKDKRYKKQKLASFKKEREAKFKTLLTKDQFEIYMNHAEPTYAQFKSPFK